MTRQLTACSPAKLILSGEHAVVYGHPALVMAVNRYTNTTATWHKPRAISFKLLDLEYAKTHTLQALSKLRTRLQDNYYSFLNGNCHITDVLKRPFELLQYCVTNLIHKLNLQLPNGLEIKVDSSIPIGCGMGSSAAAVISTLHVLNRLFCLDLDIKNYFKLAREAENMQHGCSSGTDLHIAAYGGCLQFQNGISKSMAVPDFPLFIVNTGVPKSGSGECIVKAKKYFKTSDIGSDFASVAKEMKDIINNNNFNNNNFNNFKNTVKNNHKLLKTIGVVPDRVADFIEEIEKIGGAAKICGAGGVGGEEAGVVLLVPNQNQELEQEPDQDLVKVANKYGYNLQHVVTDARGTRLL